MEITTVSGPSFFLRTIYLSEVLPDEIVKEANFEGSKENDIINSGLCFAAEQKALDYLNRSEHCRFLLTRKLLAKGHSNESINKALDYLEGKNYLNDKRFAKMWLNNRKINHTEGRIKLKSELLLRGISKVIVEEVLEEFFNENSEEQICLLALKKGLKLKKSEDTINSYLIKKGFSVKLVNRVRELYES